MISALDPSLLQKTRRSSEDSKQLENFLEQLSRTADDNAIDRVIALYEKTIVALEQEIWKTAPAIEDIKRYQDAFTVLEKLHELKTSDSRYDFKIVIPVADRPQHLKHCLRSLLKLCEHYGYGGYKNDKYNKISVLIADDSSDTDNITRHKRYCADLEKQGIKTEYFGLDEQLTLTRKNTTENSALTRIISSTGGINEPTEFAHKGASIMRNITYLKLNQLLTGENKNTLIYFIDSDQEFCINAISGSADNYYAINYFHYLNSIFKTQDVSILTGKVVGDPPVSPSVMAANFQQDVDEFLSSAERLKADAPCQFHQHTADNKDDAAYHDMANLFGFSEHEQAFDYHCTLKEKHSNADCFNGFSEKLSHFFYGEHPTRKTFFHYGNGFSNTVPARTVYTGNYVIKSENLEHFIPFATLKLRMAGPVLGRILNAELRDRFVSANLPMLHNRTVDTTGQAEFRAGVKNDNTGIDLSDEFIRQFYGDVMLFSIIQITEKNISFNEINKALIQSIIAATHADMKENYFAKHETVLQLKNKISSSLSNNACWWNDTAGQTENIAQAKRNFQHFIDNIRLNFDEESHAYQQIFANDAEAYLAPILQAILHYQHDKDSWKEALHN